MKPTDIPSTRPFIQGLPKVELHVHLEGTVTPEFWLHLLEKHAAGQPTPSLAELRQRFQFETFADFIEAFRDILFAFKTPEDFYDLTREFLTQAAQQNVRYCEVMMTPWFVQQQGVDYHELMAEIDRAAKEIEAQRGIEMKLILDGPRNFGNEVVKAVFDMALADRTGRVIGVGLGGDEKNFPAHLYQDEFAYARANGLKTIAHAGETDGEKSMVDAITLLKATRLGHCLGIEKASALEAMIMENNITLDLCPWSNVATGSLGEIGNHPLPEYLQRGYPITLNSDDPGMFKTSINREFETMADLYHLTQDQLKTISRHAVHGSFLAPTKKELILKEIDSFTIDN